MNPVFANVRRLEARGSANRGVAVDAEGAMLGPDCVLVRRTASGYRCVSREEARRLQNLLVDPGDQITGLPPGLEVKLNGVRFDGCREADGTMLEAKGPGYADKMEGTESWQDWFTGSEGIEAQMQGQARARRRPHDGVAFRRAAGSRFLPKMGRG